MYNNHFLSLPIKPIHHMNGTAHQTFANHSVGTLNQPLKENLNRSFRALSVPKLMTPKQKRPLPNRKGLMIGSWGLIGTGGQTGGEGLT